MLVDNHYTCALCGTDWTTPDCDSFHDDRCPECDSSTSPHSSTEYTDEGEKEHYHE